MARKAKNYLEYVPLRNPKNLFHEREEGLITITVPHNGVYDKLAQKIFKTPPASEIDLDRFGSFVFLQIDGERSIYEIAQLVEEAFGEDAHPLYERLVKYFRILKNHGFVSYQKEMKPVSESR